MKYGYFDDDAKEYVIFRPDTPRPWSNYLGSTEYGAIITNNAGGYSFYKSAATGRFLRMRFNAIPMDQPGRYFYLRDQDTGDYWSSSWQPVGKPLDQYKSTCRHGTAYTAIDSEYAGIKTESLYFVPLGQTFEYWRVKVTNQSEVSRKLSLFTYCEFANLWHTHQDLVNLQYSLFITKADWKHDMLGIASNPYIPYDGKNLTSCGRTWMAMAGSRVTGYETVRERFLGTYGGYAQPETVLRGQCSNFLAEGDNNCGTLQTDIVLQPGEEKEIIVMLGLGTPDSHGKDTVAKFGNPEVCEAEFAKLKAHWHADLEAIKVKTPDEDFDHMINVWNAYNSLITYAWSRAASLVYNGERDGLGFRDTVQDFLGVIPMLGDRMRERLELMLTGQVACGGAIPVIKPFSHNPGQEKEPPKEEFRSDDCLWFFNAIPAYVAETGNVDFYNKVLPYADKGEATVFGHLRQALEFNLTRTGRNGLPCGLSADWNDCLQLGYEGESVFVAFQLRLGLTVYSEIAELLNKPEESVWALAEREKLDAKIQKVCWDGDWFIWAIGDDGTIYGTKDYEEGQVYMNTQVWAVISGAATDEQAVKSMKTLNEKLATEYGIMLCGPALMNTDVSVMRAVLFNKGIKENAGIFSHTQSWGVIAECMLGNGDTAYDYYRAFMPAAQNDQAEIRQTEPYVHCQTTYSRYNRNFGASRVPWLSGTVSWTYYSGTHYILGVRPEIEGLRIDPCIPSKWDGFSMERAFRGKTVNISVTNPDGVSKGVKTLTVNGEILEGNLIPLDKLTDVTEVDVVMG